MTIPDSSAYLSDLILAYSAYVIATLSPGPANLAIVGASMSLGRKPGLALACGVVSGSMCWAALAAIGLSALLTMFGWAFAVIKIGGGAYLLWLALRFLRSAMSPQALREPGTDAEPASLSTCFVRGFAIHMTNPKAVFGWIAIIAIGLKPEAPAWVAFSIVAGCAVLGAAVFGGYAMAFSTRSMMRLYGDFRRWIEGAMAVFFTFAGIKLLTSRF